MGQSFVPPAVPKGRKKRDQKSKAGLQALDRCRGGFATKIDILCDGKGNPLTAVLSPAQDHESKHLKAVMSSIQLTGSEQGEPIVTAKVAGDKGYRSQWIDEWLLGCFLRLIAPWDSAV